MMIDDVLDKKIRLMQAKDDANREQANQLFQSIEYDL